MLGRGTPDATQTIVTTWGLSIERASEQHPSARALLEVASFLAPDAIPRSLFVSNAAAAAELDDLLVLAEATAACQTYSLIGCDVDCQELSVHRLVQAVVRLGLESPARHSTAVTAADMVLFAMPDDPFDVRNWPQASPLAAHAQQVAGHLQDLDRPEYARSSRLLSLVGRYLRGRGDFAQARHSLVESLREAELAFGKESAEAAWAENRLASVLRDLGDRAKAGALFQHSAEVRVRLLGPDHADLAWSLNGLGNLAADEGRLDDALNFYQRGLTIRESSSDGPSPEIAWSMNAIAECRQGQGDLQEAKRLFEDALAMRVASLGDAHPDVAWSLEGLARCHRDDGSPFMARQLFSRAFDVCENALGPRHPYVARALDGLLTVTVNDRERLPLLERLVKIGRANYGPSHHKLLRWEYELANCRAQL